MELIPLEERNKWISHGEVIIKEIDTMNTATKAEAFKETAVTNYYYSKGIKFLFDQIVHVDCELEHAENKNIELEKQNNELKKVIESNVVNPDAIRDIKVMNTVVPFTDEEKRARIIKIFQRRMHTEQRLEHQ